MRVKFGRTKETVNAIGFGTWKIGGGWNNPDRSHDRTSVDIIKLAISLGADFVDTAEAYGGGHSEELVGQALSELRKDDPSLEVFLATKVSPEHLHYEDVMKSCNASLRRLGVNQIDLYQVHWPNPRIPLSETMSALEDLVTQGKVRYVGVSNFPVELLEEAQSNMSKYEIQSDQVKYSLLDREPEENGILEFCRKNSLSLVAYSPLARGELASSTLAPLDRIAQAHGATRAQVFLAWLLSKGPVLPIPKASKPDHLRENMEAAGITLSPEEIAQIDGLSPSGGS